MKSLHLFFSGNVQGVGFRFVTRSLAYRYNVKGWVRNLSDGRVEVVAEADQDALERFLEDLNNHFKYNITGVVKEELGSIGGYEDFQILF